MSEILRLIVEFGLTPVLAAAFIVGSALLVRAYIKATADFARIMEQSNTVITNHMHDANNAIQEQTRVLERLCIYSEMPNRDYLRREGTE